MVVRLLSTGHTGAQPRRAATRPGACRGPVCAASHLHLATSRRRQCPYCIDFAARRCLRAQRRRLRSLPIAQPGKARRYQTDDAHTQMPCSMPRTALLSVTLRPALNCTQAIGLGHGYQTSLCSSEQTHDASHYDATFARRALALTIQNVRNDLACREWRGPTAEPPLSTVQDT